MARFGDCPTCQAIIVDLDTHRCPPVWEVRWPFAGSSSKSVHAFDAEQAAAAYCDRWDAEQHEMGILISGEARLSVTREGKTVQVDVFAEQRPHYSAREILA
jgi:hypothetical protein